MDAKGVFLKLSIASPYKYHLLYIRENDKRVGRRATARTTYALVKCRILEVVLSKEDVSNGNSSNHTCQISQQAATDGMARILDTDTAEIDRQHIERRVVDPWKIQLSRPIKESAP